MQPTVKPTTLVGYNENLRVLETSGRLRLDAAACLRVRFAGDECDLCRTACPAACIELTADGPSLKGDCLGCGQCAANCPSDALQMTGFTLSAAFGSDTANDEVPVDCWRVAFDDSPRDTLRVPCLAGISKGWLLDLFDRSGEKTIHLLDRGECGFCPAGSGIKALLATLTEVRTLLFECGVDIPRLPAMTALPAQRPLSPNIPSSASEVRVGRRGFFRGLVGSVARGTDEIAAAGAPEAPAVLREPIFPAEQMRVTGSLARIAARRQRAAPSRVFPQLSLADCSAHGVCAGVCPTGALTRTASDTSARLQFHASKCIACGQCERNCPDHALKLSHEGGRPGIDLLAEWSAKECLQCGETIFGRDAFCVPCGKNQQFHHGMAGLFGRSHHQ